MGCDGINTLEYYEKENNEISTKKNLCKKIYTGELQPDINFIDSIIKNNEDLEEKLRAFIPTKIKKDGSDIPTFNTKDDILTKSVNFDFNENYLIALRGVNRVLKVEEIEGNYLIYHDNQAGHKNKYISLVVAKIGSEPNIYYDKPKPTFKKN